MLIMLILLEIMLILIVYCFGDRKFLNTYLTNKIKTKRKKPAFKISFLKENFWKSKVMCCWIYFIMVIWLCSYILNTNSFCYFFFADSIMFRNKLPLDIGVILTVFYDIIFLRILSICISIKLQRSVTTWKEFVAFLCINMELFLVELQLMNS